MRCTQCGYLPLSAFLVLYRRVVHRAWDTKIVEPTGLMPLAPSLSLLLSRQLSGLGSGDFLPKNEEDRDKKAAKAEAKGQRSDEARQLAVQEARRRQNLLMRGSSMSSREYIETKMEVLRTDAEEFEKFGSDVGQVWARGRWGGGGLGEEGGGVGWVWLDSPDLKTRQTREKFWVPQERRNHRSNLSTLRVRGPLHRTWNCFRGPAPRRSHGALPHSDSGTQPLGGRTGPCPIRILGPGPGAVSRGPAPLGFWGPAPRRSHGALPLSASGAQPHGGRRGGGAWYGMVWYGVVWCGVVWCGVVWCGVVWCGVVWCGVVWCGVVWRGVVWCGVVWCGVVWCGVVWCGVVRCGVVWCGVVWCGVVWCGMVWCGVVWCGAVRCGAVRCGVVWYGMVWYGMVWYGMVWYGMVWYGMVWYGMVWYGMVWYGMVWYGMVWYGMVWYGMVWYGMVWYGMNPPLSVGGEDQWRSHQRWGLQPASGAGCRRP